MTCGELIGSLGMTSSSSSELSSVKSMTGPLETAGFNADAAEEGCAKTDNDAECEAGVNDEEDIDGDDAAEDTRDFGGAVRMT